jgi:hypothetical protein
LRNGREGETYGRSLSHNLWVINELDDLRVGYVAELEVRPLLVKNFTVEDVRFAGSGPFGSEGEVSKPLGLKLMREEEGERLTMRLLLRADLQAWMTLPGDFWSSSDRRTCGRVSAGLLDS